MSGENVEGVRQPISVGVHSRRRLVERLALRLPPALRFLCVIGAKADQQGERTEELMGTVKRLMRHG